uniref:Uncharacterized protein n=1 Tax=Lotus japonicus TaxID=34305 RepID=I3S1H6_LOTJA|nr:unknown [Lotus japonicus]
MVAERVTGTTSLAEPHWKCSKTEATPFPPPKSNSPSLNSVKLTARSPTSTASASPPPTPPTPPNGFW